MSWLITNNNFKYNLINSPCTLLQPDKSKQIRANAGASVITISALQASHVLARQSDPCSPLLTKPVALFPLSPIINCYPAPCLYTPRLQALKRIHSDWFRGDGQPVPERNRIPTLDPKSLHHRILTPFS